MNDTDNARSEYIAGLRELADLLERTPELPLPDDRRSVWYLFGSKELPAAAQKARAAAFVRMLPGAQEKVETGQLFRFVGRIRGVKTEVIVDRDAVCRRVVTGTREVTRTMPAPDAPTVEVTETVEDVKWVCEPLLADATTAESVSA